MAQVVRIDATNLTRAVRRIREVAPRAGVIFEKATRDAGLLLREAVKSEAGKYSRSIPPTVRVREIGPSTVEVSVGGDGVAIADLFERDGETFSHPVFGSPTTPWVKQPTHHYFHPAIERSRPAVSELFKRAADGWCEELARHSEL